MPSRFEIFVRISVLLLCCGNPTSAQSGALDRHPITTLNAAQGGTIIYGTVDRADTLGKAMASVLDNVGRNCGEKPKVGRVFRVRDGGSAAVFFTVSNHHSAGGRPVAGMLLAAATGPQTIDAALVSDDASRFPQTLNPMLKQLFTVWHPYPAASTQPGPGPAAQARGSAPALRNVANSDHSATVGLPSGWTLDPRCNSGQILIHGPAGELVGINLFVTALNPNDPLIQRNLRMGIRQPRLPGVLYYPYSANVAQNLPGLYQEWKHSLGQQAPALQVESVHNLQGSNNMPAAQMDAHVNPDGKGMQKLQMSMALAPPVGSSYKVFINFIQVPVERVEGDRDTLTAIVKSVSFNLQVIQGEARAANEVGIRMAKQATDNINRNAEATKARIRSDQEQHEAQWRNFDADQDMKSRRGQEFGNYILDRSVVQDNNMFGNGTIGHGTLDNADADWLVKHYPDRFEYVDKPNYWLGTDYHR